LTIGGIARGAGTGAETIRFYECDSAGNDAPHDNAIIVATVFIFFSVNLAQVARSNFNWNWVFMPISFLFRFTWIARLALGIVLFGQFALTAEACLSQQRTLAGTPVVTSEVAQDQQTPCSRDCYAALMLDAEVCLTDVTSGQPVSGPPINNVMPGITRWSGFTLAPQPAIVPLTLSRLDMVTGSSGSHLSILFRSFQI